MNKIFIALLKYWKEKTNNQKKKKKHLKVITPFFLLMPLSVNGTISFPPLLMISTLYCSINVTVIEFNRNACSEI